MDLMTMINNVVTDKRVTVTHNVFKPICAYINLEGDICLNMPTTIEGVIAEMSRIEMRPVVKLLNKVIHDSIDTNGYESNLEAFIYFLIAHEYGHCLDFIENNYKLTDIYNLCQEEYNGLNNKIMTIVEEYKKLNNNITDEYKKEIALLHAQEYRQLPSEKKADDYAIAWLQNNYSVVCV